MGVVTWAADRLTVGKKMAPPVLLMKYSTRHPQNIDPTRIYNMAQVYNRTIYTYNSKAIQNYSHMTTANGFIKGVAGGTQFTSTFIIDDIQYHFSGNFNPAVQDFTSNEAILTYTSVGQLTTHRAFDGKIGTDTISLSIKNGPTIDGPLVLPINPASRVSGRGTWAQN
ncbi:hypothetical protein NHJ13734_000908 [Beauveria thailandica]